MPTSKLLLRPALLVLLVLLASPAIAHAMAAGDVALMKNVAAYTGAPNCRRWTPE